MREIKFEHISDAYFLYWKMYLKYRMYEFTHNELPIYFILDNIFSSFLVEIGLKALTIYENRQIKNNHNLDCLFNQLSMETQTIIAKELNIELTELKEELKKNAEHFKHWRYYYELETGSINIKFFEELLNVITALLTLLREKQINNKIENNETTPEDKEYYEALERKIVKEATDNGVSFEQAALIADEIKKEGLKDFAFCNMLESKLAELQNLK